MIFLGKNPQQTVLETVPNFKKTTVKIKPECNAAPV